VNVQVVDIAQIVIVHHPGTMLVCLTKVTEHEQIGDSYIRSPSGLLAFYLEAIGQASMMCSIDCE
jgi:hypothetical protein